MNITARARALATKTADAHSVPRYASWPACAQVLLTRGMTDREAEAVLRSKWMRWAADSSNERYGRVPAKAIAAVLDSWDAAAMPVLLQELVDGTFGVQEPEDIAVPTVSTVPVVKLGPWMYSFLDAAGHCMADKTPPPDYRRWAQSDMAYRDTLLVCNLDGQYLYRTYAEAHAEALRWDPANV